MSNFNNNPLGLPVGRGVDQRESFVPGAKKGGFTLPPTEAPERNAATAPASVSTDEPGALVGKPAVGRPGTFEPQTQTLGEGYDKLPESARGRYASLFASYFPS